MALSKTLDELAGYVGGEVSAKAMSSSTESRPSTRPSRARLLFLTIPGIGASFGNAAPARWLSGAKAWMKRRAGSRLNFLQLQ